MSESIPQPVIAVITPTYNRAGLIRDALDSVLAQDAGVPIEVAVVDDGSTDNTLEVIKPYLEKYGEAQSQPAAQHSPPSQGGAGGGLDEQPEHARHDSVRPTLPQPLPKREGSAEQASAGNVTIRYTRLEKQGVVTARNTAIAQTSAPFIAMLDSDDYWAPDKLRKQLAILKADSTVALVHTSFRYVNEQGRITDDGPQRLNNPCVGNCLDTLLHEFLVLFSSVMVRRSVVESAAVAESHGQPFDPRWTNSQDYDLCLRCARFGSFAYIAEPLTLYRIHGSHGAMGNLARAFGFHCRVQMDFVKRYGESIGIDEAEIKRRVATFLLGRAESAFWQRQLETSRKLVALARELGVGDGRFDALEKKASRPAWLYKLKDAVDRLRGKDGR